MCGEDTKLNMSSFSSKSSKCVREVFIIIGPVLVLHGVIISLKEGGETLFPVLLGVTGPFFCQCVVRQTPGC